jgi:hypothetical protein
MDAALITAAAAVAGSLVGGLTSFATTYLSQRHQDLRERVSRELSRREKIYTRFNGLAVDLMFDAVDHSLDEPAKLAGIMMLIGRIRLSSSERVLSAAENLLGELLASYQKPAIDRRDVVKAPDEFAKPLKTFTQACRIEREEMLRQL